MEVTLNTTPAVQPLTSLAEAVKANEVAAPAVTAPLLAGEGVTVKAAATDLEALLAQMRMETNEARLNAARSRLSSALDQLTGLSDEQQANVNALKQTGEALNAAETQLAQTEDAYTEKSQAADRAQKAVDTAENKVKSATKRLEKAESDLATAQAELDAFKQVNTANAPGLDALETAVAEAEAAVTDAKTAVTLANAALDKAQETLAEAEAAEREAKDVYLAAKKDVETLREKFDQQLHDLDSSSIQALREAVQVTATDLEHLHEEIEEEDKEHSLATVRSVEDVIADSLKRLDGEIVDEVESRHLDHV